MMTHSRCSPFLKRRCFSPVNGVIDTSPEVMKSSQNEMLQDKQRWHHEDINVRESIHVSLTKPTEERSLRAGTEEEEKGREKKDIL